MPGIAALGKLFFEKKCVRETVAYVPAAAHAGSLLIVRKIIRLKSGRRSKHLIAIDVSAAVPARKEFAFAGIRRDDRSSARGQPKNQSPVRGNTDDPTADRTGSALWPIF
jgi:hypothetical protein